MNANVHTEPADFTPDAMHAEDLHAAKLVVGLITSVFLFGLFMYTFIMWIAL